MQPEDALIDRQQQEIAMLRERVRQLTALLAPRDVLVRFEWGLTTSEARLFAFLTTRELCSKAEIMNALYALRPEADEVEPKIVDVFVCKLRKKLRPFGVEVETVWGQGYRLKDRQHYQNSSTSRAAA